MGEKRAHLGSFARYSLFSGAISLLTLGFNAPFAMAETAQTDLTESDLAQFSDLRIGKHDDYCRVVLDTDARVNFEVDLSSSAPRLKLSGLAAPARHEKLSRTYAPVDEVHLAPTGAGSAELSFVVTQPVVMRVSRYGANASGVHRLVVDLYFSEVIELSMPSDREQVRGDPRVRVVFGDALKE